MTDGLLISRIGSGIVGNNYYGLYLTYSNSVAIVLLSVLPAQSEIFYNEKQMERNNLASGDNSDSSDYICG